MFNAFIASLVSSVRLIAQPTKAVRTDAVDLRHINTRQLVQNGAHVKADGVRLDRAVPGLRQGSTRTCLLRAERSEHRLDLRITFVDTGLIKVVERQRLGE